MQDSQNEFGERGSRSGAGTNLKVGAPVRSESGGTDFFWSCPSTFWLLKVQLVVLVSAFVMVSTIWSVCCLLFFYSRCTPRAQPFVKVGGVHHGVGATGFTILSSMVSKFYFILTDHVNNFFSKRLYRSVYPTSV